METFTKNSRESSEYFLLIFFQLLEHFNRVLLTVYKFGK